MKTRKELKGLPKPFISKIMQDSIIKMLPDNLKIVGMKKMSKKLRIKLGLPEQ